jgi:hypothetical protein
MKTKYHILELMEVEVISWKIYRIMDYYCLKTNFFKIFYLISF